MNVAHWLNAIGLGRYEAVFREHEIDGGILRDLVEADLEKIGSGHSLATRAGTACSCNIGVRRAAGEFPVTE
jgi:hypothetical protein